MLPRRSLRQSSLAILAAGLLSVGPEGILAQTTNVTCLASFSWMDNSLGQSPCLLSAYLQGACNGGQWNVPVLPPNTYYAGPNANQQNPCQCSSITYNALSACGICQNHTITSWAKWNANCSVIYPGVFTPGVPDGTAIPQWAFQDVTTSNQFDVTLAQAVGDSPESTATHVQSTASSLPSQSTSVFTSASSTAAPTFSSSAPSSSKSNTGAIAGGVVGGVVGAALIVGVVVFFIMKKKRSQVPPSAQFAGTQTSRPFSSATYTDSTPFTPQMIQPKLYDPSDPSTFPVSPPPTTIRTVSSSYEVQNSLQHTTPSVRPGGYSGMPEV